MIGRLSGGKTCSIHSEPRASLERNQLRELLLASDEDDSTHAVDRL